jgi:ApeA N-terminal domain 1
VEGAGRRISLDCVLEDHEYQGLWWPPEDDSEPLSGTLAVRKGEAVLEVLGDFGKELLSETETQRTYSLNLEEKPRVLGMSTDGKPITLEGLSETGSSFGFPGLRKASYRAGATLVGKHFGGEEEVLFDEIAIGASDLNAWTQVSGFATNLEAESVDEEDHLGFVGTEIRYTAPDEIRIPLSRGEEMIVRFTCESKGLGGRSARIELRQDAALHWRFARPADLRSVFNRVSQVRNFLSLAVGRPVSITSVVGYQDDYRQGNTDFPRPIDIYWGIPHNPEVPEDLRHPREMLFTLADTKPDASTALKRWILRQARLEPVFNLYFGTLYHPSLYLEVRFLAFAQALETYDFRRRRKPGNLTLVQRVSGVLGQCRTVARRIVGEEADAFIADFRNSRNYYTHYNPKLERKAATGTALFLLTLQLRTILEMSLLRQLGFPCGVIEEILERGRRFEEIEHFRREVENDVDE